jgi:hypothetical protein
MLNADKYTSKDKDESLVKTIKSNNISDKEMFQKLWKEESGKEYFYKSEAVKSLANELR